MDCKVQKIIGYSIEDKSKQMVRSKLLINFQVRLDNITNTHPFLVLSRQEYRVNSEKTINLGGDGLYPDPKIFQ